MVDKINPVRETDAEALQLAKRLVGETKYSVLGVLEQGTDVPLVSRVAAAWDRETGFFFCASDLSVHSQCLLHNPACSFLLGEPGKGDGLAHPRITLIGKTARLENANSDRALFRERFLRTHPKAALYVDFTDFGFYPVTVERAMLNGGFGKAYHLSKDDLAFIRG